MLSSTLKIRISMVELQTSLNKGTLASVLLSSPVACAIIYVTELCRNAPHNVLTWMLGDISLAKDILDWKSASTFFFFCSRLHVLSKVSLVILCRKTKMNLKSSSNLRVMNQ